MEAKNKFQKYLSTDAKEAIKTEDLEESVEAAFYQVAAGKGDKAKKPQLLKAVEFIMRYYDWFSDAHNETLITTQNSEKAFSCAKCDKTFDHEEVANECCGPVEGGGEKDHSGDEDEDEESELKNMVTSQETSSDTTIKERPFKCNACPISYGHANALKQHMRE